MDLLLGGHRGMGSTDSGEARARNKARVSPLPPENTLPSLLGALRQGAAFVETDAIATADGDIVLTHSNDPSIHIYGSDARRVEGRLVEDMAVAEVTALRTGADGQGRIPTLRNLLRALDQEFPGDGMILNLELKGVQASRRPGCKTQPPLVKPVLDVIGEEKFPLERILFSSFSLATMKELAVLAPRAKSAMLFYTAPEGSSFADTVLFDDGSEHYLPFTAAQIAAVHKAIPSLNTLIPDIMDVNDATMTRAAQNRLAVLTYGYPEKSPLVSRDFAQAARKAMMLAAKHDVPLGIITDFMDDFKIFARQPALQGPR